MYISNIDSKYCLFNSNKNEYQQINDAFIVEKSQMQRYISCLVFGSLGSQEAWSYRGGVLNANEVVANKMRL